MSGGNGVSTRKLKLGVSDAAGRTRVLTVEGEVDLSNCDQLSRALMDRSVLGSETLVVDLSSCPFIDSSGIRSILVAHAASQDGDDGHPQLALVAPSGQVARILKIAGVDQQVPLHETLKAALAA